MADLKQGFLVREPLIQAVFDWQKIKTVIDWKCLVLNHNHGVISWYKNNPPKCQSDLSKLAQLIYENPPPNGVDLPLPKYPSMTRFGTLTATKQTR